MVQHFGVSNYALAPVRIDAPPQFLISVTDPTTQLINVMWMQRRSAVVLFVDIPARKCFDVGMVVGQAGFLHLLKCVGYVSYRVVGDPFPANLVSIEPCDLTSASVATE